MKYRTIVADPPWPYEGRTTPWRTAMPAHYPLMSLVDIKALPIDNLAEDAAHLYLWATLPYMEEAFAVLRVWGFAPSTILTWCKPGPGLGGGWRGNTEHLIVARRGRLPFLGTGRGTWFVASRQSHSQKPELFLDLIEEMSPAPRLELFARRNRLGWDTWGNESLEMVTL